MSTTTEVALNTQKYKLAASGAGLIICQERSRHSFRALLSMRSESVGLGLGITGGGFVEVGDLYLFPVGTVVETVTEAWRETAEENVNFSVFMPRTEFIERAQSIATMHVRTGDENGVHGTNFYALTVTDEEWDAFAAMPPGPERRGSLLEIWVNFTDTVIHRSEPEVGITVLLPDGKVITGGFYHQHELRALGHIAWHVQQGLLWPPLPQRK